jgi:archaellum component FlaC
MQVSLHKLEGISDSVIFVRQNKQQLNKTLKWLESIVETLTEQLDIFESEEYVKIVAEVEKLSSTIKLTI